MSNTITAGTKNFKAGDRVVCDTLWVSSDGPLEGYRVAYEGTIKSITPKSVVVVDDTGSVRRMKHEDFVKKNS